MLRARTLDLPDADVRIAEGWLDAAEADALFARLRAELPWEMHRIRLFGKTVDVPRLSAWVGDADASYTYSGTRFAPHPWVPDLWSIRERLRADTGIDFNSVLANLYRDGRDAMGWHSDAERELGNEPVIASLSLGATRRFVLKHRREATIRRAMDLQPGSLLMMAGGTQHHYRHALPRTARPVDARINLTFRLIRI